MNNDELLNKKVYDTYVAGIAQNLWRSTVNQINGRNQFWCFIRRNSCREKITRKIPTMKVRGCRAFLRQSDFTEYIEMTSLDFIGERLAVPDAIYFGQYVFILRKVPAA